MLRKMPHGGAEKRRQAALAPAAGCVIKRGFGRAGSAIAPGYRPFPPAGEGGGRPGGGATRLGGLPDGERGRRTAHAARGGLPHVRRDQKGRLRWGNARGTTRWGPGRASSPQIEFCTVAIMGSMDGAERRSPCPSGRRLAPVGPRRSTGPGGGTMSRVRDGGRGWAGPSPGARHGGFSSSDARNGGAFPPSGARDLRCCVSPCRPDGELHVTPDGQQSRLVAAIPGHIRSHLCRFACHI